MDNLMMKGRVYDDAVWVSGDTVRPMKVVKKIGKGAFGT